MTLIINLAVAAYLAGLFWYLQIVHYPLFTYVDKKSFLEYHIYHLKRNTYIIFIPMLLEGAFSILFAFDSPHVIPPMIPFLCLCLSTSMWLVTFSHITPLHDKLTADGLDKDTVDKLIQMNWIRTIGWTVKTLLLIYCVSKMVFLF
jgi:hypothetical protein